MTLAEQPAIVQTGRWSAASMFFVNGFVVGSWAPHIPGFAARLELNEFALGLLILCFGLGAIAAMTLAGQMVARMGSRRTLIFFALPVICALPLVVSSPNVWVAAVALTLFGGSIGGMDVAMNANVVQLEKRLQRAIMSSSHGFWSLGGFAGGALGGILIEDIGIIPHAVAVAVFAAFVVILAYSHVSEDIPPARMQQHTVSLPRQSAIYVIGAMALLCLCAEGAILSWSALFLQKELSADTSTAGFAFAGFSGAMAATRFLGDSIRNRLGAVATFRLSGLLAALAMAVVGLSVSPWVAISAFAVSGIGIANMVPILFSAAGNQPGLDAGVAMSVVTTMGHSGILLAPSIIGLVGGMVGLGPIYVALAVFLGFVTLLASRTASADTKKEGIGA